jgi:hypothetical protein
MLFVTLLVAGATAAEAQLRPRLPVAVVPTDYADTSLKLVATRLTTALRATAGQHQLFSLYDTSLTRKATMGPGNRRQLPQLPATYVCISRIQPTFSGWVQATATFYDDPTKDPVLRLSQPILISSDSSFTSFGRFVWDRLAKTGNKTR